MQLNRFLALCGVASRRKAEAIILAGRVTVNGEAVGEKGRTVDPDQDIIFLDGRRLAPAGQYRYILLNKPEGVITSVGDTHGRRTVVDLVGGGQRVFPVGRLDLDTKGVLLLTNDGDLAYRLTHPRYGIAKVYRVRVAGKVKQETLDRFAGGIEINGGEVVSGDALILGHEPGGTIVEIRLHEGKKRQIKRMMKAAGHPVVELVRVKFAGLTVEGMAPGEYRELTEPEVRSLYHLTKLDAAGEKG